MGDSDTIRAMVFEQPLQPLRLIHRPRPRPAPRQVLIRVAACGVCRTDLHLVDGELPDPLRPVIPGHQVVGTVVSTGEEAHRFSPGDRVGVPWLGRTCQTCEYCARGTENLCDAPSLTGYTTDGGFAEQMVADERYCFRLPEDREPAELAPLLCAGLIGYRSLRLCGDGIHRLGLYGFGAAAHIITQVAVHLGQRVFAFTREGDVRAQQLAVRLGAVWAGASSEAPPEALDAAIIFAPAGELVPIALGAVRKGGTVVCGGIHMSDIPSFPYRLLWEERRLLSVANLQRRDGEELLALASRVPIRTEVEVLPLTEANEALRRLRAGEVHGAIVLRP